MQIRHLLCLHVQFSEGEKPETKQKRLETKYAALQIVPNVDKLGTAKVSNNVSPK